MASGCRCWGHSVFVYDMSRKVWAYVSDWTGYSCFFFLTFCPLSWCYWSWVWNSAFPGLYYSNIKTIWKKYIMIFFYAISPGPGWQWSTYILTSSLQTVRHWERGDSERHPSVEERLEPLLCFCFQTNQKNMGMEWKRVRVTAGAQVHTTPDFQTDLLSCISGIILHLNRLRLLTQK